MITSTGKMQQNNEPKIKKMLTKYYTSSTFGLIRQYGIIFECDETVSDVDSLKTYIINNGAIYESVESNKLKQKITIPCYCGYMDNYDKGHITALKVSRTKSTPDGTWEYITLTANGAANNYLSIDVDSAWSVEDV